MSICLWEILVPYKMGDHSDPTLPKKNRNIPVPYHQLWDEKVRAITGGLTINRVATGHWLDANGKLFKELMIPVKIGATADQMQQIAEITLNHYKQMAVAYYKISDEFYIYKKE